MSIGQGRGFTIIEVMLFLAISGLMMVGLLVGTGATISKQRYNDSVYSLQSKLQAQYSAADSVEDSCRSSTDASCAPNVSCTLSGSSVSVKYGTSATTPEPRGQSDCLILGRYITTTADGNVIVMRGVVGIKPAGAGTGSDDVADLALYKIAAVPDGYDDSAAMQTQLAYLNGERYTTEWQEKLLAPTIGDPGNTSEPKSGVADYAILILKSPISGRLYTFVSDDRSPGANSMMSKLTTDIGNSATFCVDSSGAAGQGTMAVKIDANGSSSSAVEVLGDQAAKAIC